VVWSQTKRIRKRTDEEKQRSQRQMERFRTFLSEEEMAARMADLEWITGPAGAGRYTAVLSMDDTSITVEFALLKDLFK